MLIDGSAQCILDIDISEDEVWKALISSTANDGMTLEILQLLFHAFSVKTTITCRSSSNGIYYNVTDEEVIAEITIVPITMFRARFHGFRSLPTRKLNAHTVALEARVKYSF